MKHIDFWFDALSPYAWLAFDRLPHTDRFRRKRPVRLIKP